MRWLWPILFFATTGWVAWYNDHHADRKVVFPMIDTLFPEVHGDPEGMGHKSVIVLFGLSVVVTGLTVLDQVRAIARRNRQGDA